MISDTSHLFRQPQIGFPSEGKGGGATWGCEGGRGEQDTAEKRWRGRRSAGGKRSVGSVKGEKTHGGEVSCN